MNKPRIGILGSGQVAQVLGKGFLKHGYLRNQWTHAFKLLKF